MSLTRRALLAGLGAALVAQPALARPYWAFPGSYVDIDFGNFRAWGGSLIRGAATAANGSLGSLVSSTTNISAVLVPDYTGKLILQANQGMRITTGMGLWAGGSFTQQCLWNRDLTNAVWTATNITALKNQIGADGVANAASSITATANLGTISQTITAISAAHRASAYVKRLVGVGTLELAIDGATYNILPVPASGYVQLPIPALTGANPVYSFRIGTSGDSFAIDFCGCENRAAYSPAVAAATSAAVAFFNEEPAFGSPAGFSTNNDGYRLLRDIHSRGAPWSGYIEFSGQGVSSPEMFATDATYSMRGAADGTPVAYSQNSTSVTSSNTGNIGVGRWNRVAWRLAGDGGRLCLNGGPIAINGSGNLQPRVEAITHCGLGNNGAGTAPLEGCIRRSAFWPFALSDSRLVSYTAFSASPSQPFPLGIP